MGRKPAKSLDEIRKEIHCPQCEYELRGQEGDVVRCPECGMLCNIARLVHQYWNGKWYQAPGMNIMLLPVAVLVIGTVGSSILTGYIHFSLVMEGWVVFMMLMTCVVIGWIAALVYAAHRVKGGIWLGLLGHVAFGLMITGFIGTIFAGIRLVVVAVDGQSHLLLPALLILLPFVGAVFAARWCEKFIARRCIKHHLNTLAQVSETQAVKDHDTHA